MYVSGYNVQDARMRIDASRIGETVSKQLICVMAVLALSQGIARAVAQADAFDADSAPRVDPRDASRAQPTLEQSVVEGCLGCHMGALTLSDWTSDDLAIAIDDLASGRADHLVPVPSLNDEDRMALAAALSATPSP
jgi:hypothetical protein